VTKLATKLAIIQQPQTATVNGQPFKSPYVRVQTQDKNGSPVTVSGAGVTVTAGVTDSLGGFSLAGNTGTTGGSGPDAYFLSLNLTGRLAKYLMVFTAPHMAPDTASDSTQVAIKLALHTQPSTVAASGVPFASQPVVWLVDSLGNEVPVSGVSILGLVSAGNPTYADQQQSTDASGAATFTTFTITAGTNQFAKYLLIFGSDQLPSVQAADSTQLATGLVFDQAPGTPATSGSLLSPQPKLHLVDFGNNPVSLAGVSVIDSVETGGTASVTAGSPVATDAGGVATFTGLILTGTTGDNTLDFSWVGNTALPATAVVHVN
jgi:hypothetical protein